MGTRSPLSEPLSLQAPTEPLADDMKDLEDTNPSDTLIEHGLEPFTSELLPSEATVTQPVILVVDDEPYVLRAIQRLLKSRDADVLTAPNGLQAIQTLKRNENIAVVISDQFMPGMSGAELLEHIRQDYPDIVRVMLTGNNDLATAVEAINRGDVFRFVLKPWKNEELARIVEMAIEQFIVQSNHRLYQDFVRAQNDRLKLLNEELERRVQERTSALLSSREEITRLYNELQESFDSTIQVLLSSMELGDQDRGPLPPHRPASATALARARPLGVHDEAARARGPAPLDRARGCASEHARQGRRGLRRRRASRLGVPQPARTTGHSIRPGAPAHGTHHAPLPASLR